MFPFGKSAQQKRIDADALVIAAKQSEIDGLKLSLEKEMARSERIAGRLSVANNLCSDAAVRLAEIRAERDAYRTDALKFRALTSNLIPGGPKAKAKRDAANGTAAAVQGVGL